MRQQPLLAASEVERHTQEGSLGRDYFFKLSFHLSFWVPTVSTVRLFHTSCLFSSYHFPHSSIFTTLNAIGHCSCLSQAFACLPDLCSELWGGSLIVILIGFGHLLSLIFGKGSYFWSSWSSQYIFRDIIKNRTCRGLLNFYSWSKYIDHVLDSFTFPCSTDAYSSLVVCLHVNNKRNL